MEILAHIESLERDGVLLGDAAQQAGLTAPVPACPGWQVRDLLRHQAYVHAWADRHVREQLPEIIDETDEAAVLAGGPPDGELIAAYRAGHAALVATLRDADPAVTCATFLPAPSPLAFWARRQAHETAIHRYDAQSAVPGGTPGPAAAFEPAFADDGIDELIMGFAGGSPDRPGEEAERSLAVLAADTGGSWEVRLAGGVTAVRRGAGSADCVLDGPASGLYALLWNRCDPVSAEVTVKGDSAVLERWRRGFRVRW